MSKENEKWEQSSLFIGEIDATSVQKNFILPLKALKDYLLSQT